MSTTKPVTYRGKVTLRRRAAVLSALHALHALHVPATCRAITEWIYEHSDRAITSDPLARFYVYKLRHEGLVTLTEESPSSSMVARLTPAGVEAVEALGRPDTLRDLLSRVRDVHQDDLPASLRSLRSAWIGAGCPGLEG